jgi:hypothetical protein
MGRAPSMAGRASRYCFEVQHVHVNVAMVEPRAECTCDVFSLTCQNESVLVENGMSVTAYSILDYTQPARQ